MKNLKAWLIILPLSTIACSDEYTGETSETTETAQIIGSTKKSGIGPGNPANPFDLAGTVHNEILEALDETSFNSQSIEDIAVLIDSVSTSYTELALSSNYPALSTRLVEITWIVNNDNAIDGVLATSTLGLNARTSLMVFIDSLLLSADNPYEDIHPIIVSYEADILANNSFTSNDKRIILTTTSVVRYSVYERKRKDKDWETSVTNIAATVSGAEQDLLVGLKMALTVGICKTNNITQ